MLTSLRFQLSGDLLVGVGADDSSEPEAGTSDRPPEARDAQRGRKSRESSEPGKIFLSLVG